MEPTETPQDPKDDTKTPPAAPQSGAGHIDLGQILLPKKEVPGQTPQSAQRVNAGVLLEQEQHATLQTPPPAEETQKPAPAPATSVTPASEETIVKPIETYQRDIEGVVKDKNVTVLSIAAAEAERRGIEASSTSVGAPTPGAQRSWSSILKTVGLYALGLLLLAGASGALAYIVERPTSVSTPAAPTSPFIAVDDTKEITITGDTTRASLVATLTAAKQATSLSLGLMSRLLVTVASTSATGAQVLNPVDAQTFLTLVAPNVPQDLLRTINPSYLLGVHVYDGNQPFIIMHVDSYEQAYAAMLAWEPYLKQDLAPLFNYTPRPRIPEENIASTTPNPDSQFIQTGFVDSIVENHDARVIQNNSGDISLLWTFIDRNTLVITTNAATVREIISRIKNAPITPQPGQ